jgi:hypothetical protein
MPSSAMGFSEIVSEDIQAPACGQIRDGAMNTTPPKPRDVVLALTACEIEV